MPITPEYLKSADLKGVEVSVDVLGLERKAGNGLWSWRLRIRAKMALEDGRTIELDRETSLQCRQQGCLPHRTSTVRMAELSRRVHESLSDETKHAKVRRRRKS